MQFNKFRAAQIFDGYRLLHNKVLITQQNGLVEAIVDIADAGEDVQQLEGILSPGFINCHCHLELSHLKNKIPENTGLAGFVGQIVQQRTSSQEQILQSIAEAESEMLQNGIVAVGDICNRTDTLTQKEANRLYYQNFIEAMGANPSVANQNFEAYQKVYTAFASRLGAEKVSIVPHAPYSVSEALWQKIIEHPSNGVWTIHNQETAAENLWFEQKAGDFIDMYESMGMNMDFFKPTGKSSLQNYLNKFPEDQHVILVHNVHTQQADIDFSKQLNNQFYWCLCPNANYYISREMPPASMLIANECNLVLGTDSLASNYALSIWSEIQILQKHFPDIPLDMMLHWATINGAKALNIDRYYGSFEYGKKPGVIQIFNDQINVIQPSYS